MSHVRLSELSLPRQNLIRLCQTINYGHIEKLHVRDREPIFAPAPVLLADVKLDHDETARSEAALVDFEIADEVRRLLIRLEEIKNGTIDKIEVRGGLPRRIVLSLQLPETLS
jgi:hypothetical protein